MNTSIQVLYFSLSQASVDAFYKYIQLTQSDRLCGFHLFPKEDTDGFVHASDLPLFLDGLKETEGLYVIIDYPSFYVSSPNSLREQNDVVKDSFSVETAADIIRKTILGYPEVMFLFDESWRKDTDKVDFTSFLFGSKRDDIVKYYHQYDVKTQREDALSPFTSIIRKRNNLFDGTNLRYAIKRHIYDELEVRYNFSLSQDSRFNNLALCVEEEHAQNRANSYALFANGYRVLPVCTAKELHEVNSRYTELGPTLVVRDFDLQFPDVKKVERREIKIGDKQYQVNIIDYIRGIKCWDNNSKSPSDYKERIYAFYGKDSDPVAQEVDYWSKMQDVPTFFITKGGWKQINVKPHHSQFRFSSYDKKKKAMLPGLEKPISGVYYPFLKYQEIHNRYDSFKIEGKIRFGKRHRNRAKNDQNWKIDTKRKNHNHGVPLDIYDLVSSMLNKAELYFNEGNYILAAIYASDSIEILNGFHEALMLKAYHTLSISENAIALSIVGGCEDDLSADAYFRILKTEQEIKRLLSYKRGRKRSLVRNVLNQIYSDCRSFCRDKEHFETEYRFVSAMAHINQGLLRSVLS